MADFFVGRRITGIDNLQFLICDLGLAQIENPFIPLAKAPRPQSNTRNIFFICLSLNCLCELCEKHCFHQLQIGNRKPQIYDLQSQIGNRKSKILSGVSVHKAVVSSVTYQILVIFHAHLF